MITFCQLLLLKDAAAEVTDDRAESEGLFNNTGVLLLASFQEAYSGRQRVGICKATQGLTWSVPFLSI